MEKLPPSTQLDIFSRLPAESVLQCKQVCKTWCNSINTKAPLLIEMHLRHQLLLQQHHDASITSAASTGGVELGFLFLNDGKLWHTKYDDNDEQPNMSTNVYFPWTKKNVPNNQKLFMIGSCNGLICFYKPHCGVHDCFYICNPITREHIDIPRLCIGWKAELYKDRLVFGFGYHPSTKQYKVFRIVHANRPALKPSVQVYTLGEGNGWRDVTDIPFLRYMEFQNEKGTLANGELHWLALGANGREIVAFNLEKEEFHFVPSPPCVRSPDVYNNIDSLCVLGGCLCLVHRVWDEAGSSVVELWLLKKKISSASSYCVKQLTHTWHCERVFQDGSEWETWTVERGPRICGVKEAADQGWFWSMDFTIPIDDQITPLALTSKGEVLLLHSGFLFCYDPKTATLKKTVEYKGFTMFNIIPHINSFVSLKSLEEDKLCEDLVKCSF